MQKEKKNIFPQRSLNIYLVTVDTDYPTVYMLQKKCLGSILLSFHIFQVIGVDNPNNHPKF